jgi:hypothetical protein
MKQILTKQNIERLGMSFLVTPIAQAGIGLERTREAVGNNKNLGGIVNPILDPKLGGSPDQAQAGITFSSYFITIWRGLIVIGGLAVLFNFVNGAIEWITAGGEQSKIQHARQKMTNAFIGMAILVGSFATIAFLSNIFGFNLLQMTFPTP